jgi:hypothetical protein
MADSVLARTTALTVADTQRGRLSVPVAMDGHDAAQYRPPVVPFGRTQGSKQVRVLTLKSRNFML